MRIDLVAQRLHLGGQRLFANGGEPALALAHLEMVEQRDEQARPAEQNGGALDQHVAGVERIELHPRRILADHVVEEIDRSEDRRSNRRHQEPEGRFAREGESSHPEQQQRHEVSHERARPEQHELEWRGLYRVDIDEVAQQAVGDENDGPIDQAKTHRRPDDVGEILVVGLASDIGCCVHGCIHVYIMAAPRATRRAVRPLRIAIRRNLRHSLARHCRWQKAG